MQQRHRVSLSSRDYLLVYLSGDECPLAAAPFPPAWGRNLQRGMLGVVCLCGHFVSINRSIEYILRSFERLPYK